MTELLKGLLLKALSKQVHTIADFARIRYCAFNTKIMASGL